MASNLGIVTFLFTDLVDSTGYLERLGDDHGSGVRRRHLQLLRDVVANHRGREVKSLGDGLMVAFSSGLDAIRCAIAMQRAVELDGRDHPDAVWLRVGLSAGEPVQEGDDYFGTPVVVSKRLCDHARGGQILCSEVLSTLVGSRGDVDFRDIGRLRLKGIARPTRAFEIQWTPPEDPSSAGSSSVRRILRRASSAGPGRHGRLNSFPESRRRGLLASIPLSLLLIGALVMVGRSDDLASGPAGGGMQRRTSAGSLRWSTVADPVTFGGRGAQTMVRAAGAEDSYVGVGSEYRSDRDAAVWLMDSTGWHRLPRREKIFGGPGNQAIQGVDWNGRHFVAVGFDHLPDQEDAEVWTSEDGERWDRVGTRVLGGRGVQVMNRVVWARSQWVAVGYEERDGDKDAAVWVSPDGEHWRRVETADETVFHRPGAQQLRGLAASADLVVAVGYDTGSDSDPEADAAVWVSPDGEEWTRLTHGSVQLAGPGRQYMNTVATTASGFVAGGHIDSADGLDSAVWTSSSGLEWRRASPNEAALGGAGDQKILGVNQVADRLVAVGVDDSIAQRAGVWTSVEGDSWNRSPPGEISLGGGWAHVVHWVMEAGDSALALGSKVTGNRWDAAVWRAPLRAR